MVVVMASWNAFELQMQVVSLREQPDEPNAAAAASLCWLRRCGQTNRF